VKCFKSEDSSIIPGRGLIKDVHIPNPDRKEKPEGLPKIGEKVLIDDVYYKVMGIEIPVKFAWPLFPGESFGLRVEKMETKIGD